MLGKLEWGLVSVFFAQPKILSVEKQWVDWPQKIGRSEVTHSVPLYFKKYSYWIT